MEKKTYQESSDDDFMQLSDDPDFPKSDEEQPKPQQPKKPNRYRKKNYVKKNTQKNKVLRSEASEFHAQSYGNYSKSSQILPRKLNANAFEFSLK